MSNLARNNKDQVSKIQIDNDDWINYIRLTYDKNINSFFLKTAKNKSINICTSTDGIYRSEYYIIYEEFMNIHQNEL